MPFGLVGMVKGCIHLLCVMATPAQTPDLLVRHVGHHLQCPRVTCEEILAHEGAVVRLECLVVAVQCVHHDFAQGAILVALEQRIPVFPPQQFDDVPAGTAEIALKLLDNLAVTTDRTIESLQIAVDDKHQVVEVFPRRQANRTEAFRLVHLAVAAKHPHLAVGGVGNAARMQVFQEPRLVNRHQRPQPHGHRGELPEMRHQLGMRVTRQPVAPNLLSEVVHLLLAQAAFHIGPRVDTR